MVKRKSKIVEIRKRTNFSGENYGGGKHRFVSSTLPRFVSRSLGSCPHEPKELNKLWSVKTRTTAKKSVKGQFFSGENYGGKHRFVSSTLPRFVSRSIGSCPHEPKELNKLWSVKTRTTAKVEIRKWTNFCSLGSCPHELKELNKLWSVKTRTTAKKSVKGQIFSGENYEWMQPRFVSSRTERVK